MKMDKRKKSTPFPSAISKMAAPRLLPHYMNVYSKLAPKKGSLGGPRYKTPAPTSKDIISSTTSESQVTEVPSLHKRFVGQSVRRHSQPRLQPLQSPAERMPSLDSRLHLVKSPIPVVAKRSGETLRLPEGQLDSRRGSDISTNRIRE